MRSESLEAGAESVSIASRSRWTLILAGLVIPWVWCHSAWALSISAVVQAPATVGSEVSFDATVDGAQGPVKISWDFGDGTHSEASTSSQATHTYKGPGNYPVIVRATDSANTRTDSYVQIIHRPLTPRPASHSRTILYDSKREMTWNVNPDHDSVTAIATDTLEVAWEVSVGRRPRTIAQVPSGDLWVANEVSDEITILDPDSGVVTGHIKLPRASQPHAVVVLPAGDAALVSLKATGRVARIDVKDARVLKIADIVPTPAALAVSHDGRTALATRLISGSAAGEIAVFDPQTLMVLRRVPLPLDPGPDLVDAGRGLPNMLLSVAIAPDGLRAWYSAKKDNIERGLARDGQPLTFDNMSRTILGQIDIADGVERINERVDIDNRGLMTGFSFTPWGNYVLSVSHVTNWIGVVDAYREA